MSQDYFQGINYSMANEDSSLEYNMTAQLKPKKILSVCGSGGRALPLLHATAEELICVDLSKEQLALLELRKQSILQLDFQDFLLFWGYPPYYCERFCDDRKKFFNTLELSESTREFFDKVFVSLNWQSLLYVGKWESTFITLSKAAKWMLGKHCEIMFQQESLAEQNNYFQHEFPRRRWLALLGVVGNKALFDALLYKGSFVKKNIPQSYFKFYKQTFDHLFSHDLIRKNFFLQLCFLGEVRYEEGAPIEAQLEAFNRTKESLQSVKLTIENKDLLAAINKHQNIDFVSMSDVPSYFSGDVEKNFLQSTKPHLSKGAVVVVRSYLRVPEADRSGFVDITDNYREWIEAEKVGVYNIEVLQYEG